jgi:hypothetical protein
MAVPARGRRGAPTPAFWTPGELLAWPAAIVYTLSSFMGWYGTTIDGLDYAVTGWHSGVLGKLVFLVGLATLVLLVLRPTGFELPATFPTGMVLASLGAVATIFVLIRLIELPGDYPETGRSIGIWISLVAALALIVAGVLKTGEEL